MPERVRCSGAKSARTSRSSIRSPPELYDAGKPCGAQANAAKLLAADAGFKACDRAIRTHGGMGYAADFHVERYFREMMATQLAPVSQEMILCYLAERELGLPRSY
jgi:acyl-CoA dehydrogenase